MQIALRLPSPNLAKAREIAERKGIGYQTLLKMLVHEGLPRAEIDRAADEEVVFTFKNGTTRKFSGRSLLLTFSVPQFFFHVTTAYDILRHAGVDLAKKDFLGPPR